MEEKRQRSKMKAVSEAARGWAAGLAAEAQDWPGVTLKSAFGMTLVYRKGVVFAALPRTRALYEEDAILLKFNREPAGLAARISAEPRFAAGSMEQRRTTARKTRGEGYRWRIFLVRDGTDLHAAIEWMAEAHRLAGGSGKQARG